PTRSRCFATRRLLFLFGKVKSAPEPLDTAARVDKAPPGAGEKRMALGADLDRQSVLGGTRFKSLSERACDCGAVVGGMNARLHHRSPHNDHHYNTVGWATQSGFALSRQKANITGDN